MMARVALITGGASGIGRAIATRFAGDGARVMIADRDSGPAEDAATAIEAAGGRAAAVTVDVTDPDQVASMCAACEAAFGCPEILVTCAGVGLLRPFLETDLDAWNTTLAVNLTGTFLTAQAVAQRLVARKTGWGRIITVGSINSHRGITERAAYGASKGGVAMLTRVMAIELAAHGITVNSLTPGPIDTPMAQRMHSQATRDAYYASLPIKRYGRPEEVAAAAAFLASDDAGYITGHLLDVDGGFVAAGVMYDPAAR